MQVALEPAILPAPKNLAQSEFPLMAQRVLLHEGLTPFEELYSQGIRLLQVDATFSEDLYHPELRAWKAPDLFDYSAQELYWEKLLTACPEARLCLRLYAASPPWWDQAHPLELQRYADGSTEANLQRTNRQTLPSLASILWRESACAALSRFLNWLEVSGWSPRIWGFLLSYGITWEWGILGTDQFPDYSEPMRRAFRAWLYNLYQDVSTLQKCWGDPEVTFETAEIPTLQARLAGDKMGRVFPRDRPSADFQNCLAETNCDYLLALGSTVRAACGHRYKLGAFYGYTLTARSHSSFTARYGAGGLTGGHHAFGRFLRSRLFDFNASPYAYSNRDLGRGCLIQHFPRSSCQWHGLHVYDENDLRTFLVAGSRDDREISIGQTETLEDTLEHQRWAMAQALCHGTSYWWTELSDWIGPYKPYFNHPAILAELRRCNELFSRLQKESAPEPAQIALIIDESSVAALSLGSKLFKEEVYDQLASWSWCGAPFEVWLADDISPLNMAHIRLAYVFSPAPSDKLKARLRSTLCRDNRTVWWAPSTGGMTDQGRNNKAFTELTGHVNPDDYSELRREKMEGWTSLYGAAASLDSRKLSAVASAAGVELFGEAPLLVMKGKRFLALQAPEKKSAAIRVGGSWQDVWTGEIVDPTCFCFEKNKLYLLRSLD